MIDFFAWTIAGFLVIVTVAVHYETILIISDRILPWAQRSFHGRRVMIISIGALLVGHILEIWIFSLGYFGLSQSSVFGSILGVNATNLNDMIYFSSVNYTSLGDNSMRAMGALRAIAASETLAGMMMIAWSASFTYLKMEQIWKLHQKN